MPGNTDKRRPRPHKGLCFQCGGVCGPWERAMNQAHHLDHLSKLLACCPTTQTVSLVVANPPPPPKEAEQKRGPTDGDKNTTKRALLPAHCDLTHKLASSFTFSSLSLTYTHTSTHTSTHTHTHRPQDASQGTSICCCSWRPFFFHYPAAGTSYLSPCLGQDPLR